LELVEPDAGEIPDHYVAPNDAGPALVAAARADNEAAPERDSGVTCNTCSAYADPTALGPVESPLVELSGLAASRRHPGIVYAHNDSGDSARFFALDKDSEIVAEVDLKGATAIDWEDMAIGPCPSGSCVYLADIGDNGLSRREYAIYRVAEPETLPGDGRSVSVDCERFPFVYPDGAHNAETLLVHPATGRLFVVTKAGGVPATVYEMPLPLKAYQSTTLVRLTTMSLSYQAGVITGGDFHPCANRMLLRTYAAVYELSNPPGAEIESLFSASPIQVPAALEPVGEAVAYAADGRGYFTASEAVAGQTPMLNFTSCR
jgi:hypothetical protein